MRTAVVRFAAVAVIFALRLAAAPEPAVFPAAVFDATAHGAVGDGRTDNTRALQQAIQAAAAAGGGTVRIPAAPQPYLSGPLVVSARILLQIEPGAVLQALPYGAGSNRAGTYPLRDGAYQDFLTFNGSHVGLSGGGVIEGSGGPWWAAFNTDSTIPRRPNLVQFTQCSHVVVRDVTLRHAPMFHVSFGASHHVTVDGVTITAPADSPNTDGINPSGSHYLIQRCAISTGDDNICLKPQLTFCSDITIRQCRFGTGHGLSIGGQTNAGVDGLVVTDCTFEGTLNGLRLKADPTAGGVVQNLSFSDLTMTDVPYPIVFYSYYNLVGQPGSTTGSNRTTPAKVAAWNATPPTSAYRLYATSTMPVWRNITLRNVTATRRTGAVDGYCILWGLPNQPVANVVLHDVVTVGYAGFAFFNAADVQLTGSTRLAGEILSYNAQVVTSAPLPQVTSPGGAAIFTAATLPAVASRGAAPVSFRWARNGLALIDGVQPDGVVITGAATPRLTVLHAPAGGLDGFTVVIATELDAFDGELRPGAATTLASTAPVAVTTSSRVEPGRLINVSVRSVAGRDDAALIAGFTVGSAEPDARPIELLVRGMGPSLAAFGVTGLLGDPVLTVFTGSAAAATNDDWAGDARVRFAAAQAGAFAFAGDTSRDAAIVHAFGLGGHTALVAGGGADPGAAIAEVYDLTRLGVDPPTRSARIINLSARGRIEVGEMLFAGFRIGGATPRTVLIRAVGPSLAVFGVTGFMADPQLGLFGEGGTSILVNDDWGGGGPAAAAFGRVGAFSLPLQSKDSALITTLPPGAYTAQVTGVGGARGTVLLEVYDVP